MPDSLYALLQQAAVAAPDHPAVLFREHQLSYRQLLDDSTRAGDLLAEQGPAPGQADASHTAFANRPRRSSPSSP